MYLVNGNFELTATFVYFLIQFPKALVSLVVLVRNTIENSTEHADIIDIDFIGITVRGIIFNQPLLT
ncbi:hypothetical protein D3C84_1121150 [compost metagenome]